MTLFDVIAILLTLTALLSYFNHRYVRLHPSIGVMLIALILSLALIGLGALGLGVRAAARDFLQHIHFGDALLTWMLGFLLFAGALTVDINELRRQWQVTTLLATVGTAASMFIVAVLMHRGIGLAGLSLPWIGCLLLGALISPTDPVAVVAVTRQAGAGKAIDTIVSSESLLNDGVGVVLFLTILHAAAAPGGITISSVLIMLAREAGGGAVLGFCTGLITYRLLKNVRNFQIEVLLTLALVMGTYSLALALELSGPIAVVAAGLLIGNRGRIFRMAEHVTADLERFWELLDELLNAILFVLIGVEVLVMPFTTRHFVAALIAIPIVLLARAVTVAAAVALPLRPRVLWPTASILIWGGLRGGLAVAMALSLPEGPQRDLIVAITYGVVCFSILVQGTTIKPLVQRTILFSRARQPA
jgi:monovalent cation:H+ antiporter, CPA1 family